MLFHIQKIIANKRKLIVCVDDLKLQKYFINCNFKQNSHHILIPDNENPLQLWFLQYENNWCHLFSILPRFTISQLFAMILVAMVAIFTIQTPYVGIALIIFVYFAFTTIYMVHSRNQNQ